MKLLKMLHVAPLRVHTNRVSFKSRQRSKSTSFFCSHVVETRCKKSKITIWV